jgi:hypothetical protein
MASVSAFIVARVLLKNITDQRLGNRIMGGEDENLAKLAHTASADMIATENSEGLGGGRIRLRISHLPCLRRLDDEAERVDGQWLVGMSPGQLHGFLRRASDLGTIPDQRLLDLAIVCRGLELLEESPPGLLMSLYEGLELLPGAQCFPSW